MSKDLFTEILETVTAVHAFITGDLARENLSPDCKTKRDRFSQLLNELCTKIRAVPPSMRPRMNTPSGGKPPAPPPADILELTEEDEEGEMYTDMEGMGLEEPTDYLEFEPSQASGGSQEMYEAMGPEGQDDDVYEEPRPGPQDEGEGELYEEPSSSDGRPSTSSSLQPPTPSQSRENSASGAEFIESTRERAQADRSSVFADISTDWNTIYSPPKKGSGDSKVASLKGVSIKGILEKLGGHSKKNWQKRYCVMSGPLMYFYEKESSKSYNNFICVLNFTVAYEPKMTIEKKKQFAFKLTHTDTSTGSKKDYCFRAISAETRDKWINAIEKVIKPSTPLHLKTSGPSLTVPGVVGMSATLPRMPSGGSVAPPPTTQHKSRAQSMSTGDADEELYEDMPAPIKEESEDDEDYLPVSPVHEGQIEELTSSSEYIDVPVQPGADEVEEEYEDATAYQADLPPPPITQPPGPPTSHPIVTPPIPTVTPPLEERAPKKPAPPPPPTEPEVDTDKTYSQGSNGIVLKKVYVVLWDFEAHDKDELCLSRGDLVLVNEPSDGSDWWFGELLDNNASVKVGKKGLFPRQYSDLAFEPLEA